MSKVLYPKPAKPSAKSPVRTEENLEARPYHVEYSDPAGELDSEWGFYKTELGVKVAAWYNCRLLGFRSNAVLYDRDEALEESHE